MKKSLLSVVPSLVLVFLLGFPVLAAEGDAPAPTHPPTSTHPPAPAPAPVLRFDENGEFKILHLCDCQDVYPAHERMLKFIDATIKKHRPDIIVLGGDNTVGPGKDRDAAIKELVSVFVENKTPFTLVFGNHDHENGIISDLEQLAMYQKYGGEYCLAHDPLPELHGDATHNLPILSSYGEEIAFNLWLFDSGDYVDDENGESHGYYDCVTADQIDWYRKTSEELERKAGKKVPSLAFQHIVVNDVYEVMFREISKDMDGYTKKFYDGKKHTIYSCLPKLENFKGFLGEYPGAGYYNYGQLDAMAERGDVLSMFFGHDHVNTYTVEIKGIKLTNTPGATYYSYGNELVRGARLITVNEKNPAGFSTELVCINDLALHDRDFAKDAGINRVRAGLVKALRGVLLGIAKGLRLFSKVISMIFK